MLYVSPQLREAKLDVAGKDATEPFEDVGHSDEARAILKDLYVGEFEKNSVRPSSLYPIPSLTRYRCFIVSQDEGGIRQQRIFQPGRQHCSATRVKVCPSA